MPAAKAEKLRLPRSRGQGGVIAAFVVVAALLFGCPLEDPGPPYTALVYVYEPDRGYMLSEAELGTLESLRHMEGEVTSLVGGVDIGINLFASLDTEEDLVGAVTVRGGSPVDLRWYLSDGIVVPEDFGSMLLLSYYGHMERCRDFFHEHGLSSSLPGHIPTFHLPTFGIQRVGGFRLIQDNAAFSPVFEAFALFPRHMLKGELPLAMNLGVVCHEYSHAVFHSVVAGDSRAPFGSFAGWPVRVENLVRSIDEAFADLFGALVTSDPEFIDLSIPERLEMDRSLSKGRQITDEMVSHLDETPFYDPYRIGSVLASVLWSTKSSIGRAALARSGLAAMEIVGEMAGPDLDLGVVAEAFFEAMEEGGRQALCEAIEEALLPLPSGCEELL